MFKIAIKNEFFAKHIRRYSNLRKLFVFKVTHIHSVKDDELRSELYEGIYTGNNTAKSTKVKRFKDIDDVSLKYLNPDENVVHDIAVSNGVTSVEFYDKIKQSGKNAEFYISDKYSTYCFTGNFITKVFSVDKKLICGYVFFILADNHINRIFFMSHLLFHFLKLFSVPEQLSKISLYDKKTISFIENKLIQEISYDVFDANIDDKFTFIRCMNLLQLPYFSEQQITIALENIKLSLKDSGIFQIGRTSQDGTNNVSIYKKIASKFIVLEHINKGYENNTLVISA